MISKDEFFFIFFFFWDRIIYIDYHGIRIGFNIYIYIYIYIFNLLDEVLSFLDRIIDVGYRGIRIGFFNFFFQLTLGFCFDN